MLLFLEFVPREYKSFLIELTLYLIFKPLISIKVISIKLENELTRYILAVLCYLELYSFCFRKENRFTKNCHIFLV